MRRHCNGLTPAAIVLFCVQPKFAGRKAGYYFGKGKAGVGYHRDAKQVRAAWEYSEYPSGVPWTGRVLQAKK
jgi:hypothetical protein